MVSDSTPSSPSEVLVIRGGPVAGHWKVDTQDGFDPPSLILKGTASFLPYVPELLPRARQLWLGPGEWTARVKISRLPVINYMADVDLYRAALRKADEVVRQIGRPAFNAPAAVLRTGRDQVAATLADVPGVRMPRTIRTLASEPSALAEAIRAEALTFPILIRPAGAHGGEGMVKIDHAKDLEATPIQFDEGPLYVTEFVDFADADGLYRKHRLVVVGQEIFLRHIIVGENWLLHSARRGENTEAEEQAALTAFAAEVPPAVRQVVMAVADALDLDYFGIDCAFLPDGGMLVFEANACMNVFHNSASSPNMWEAPITTALTALRGLLADPGRWRGQPLAAA